jgi:2-methylcitrate dehydratase PrpD
MTISNITQKFAEFIIKTRSDDIPEKAIKTAKDAMLDCLGCMCLGVAQPIGKIMLEYVKDVGAKATCAVVGGGVKTSPALAALVNGTTAHAEDYDDVSLAVLGHPTAPLFPALLSICELRRLSGRRLLDAYVIGFEIAARLGLALGVSHYNRGWHGTATTGTIGAAAACSRLLGLSEEKTRMALAIAASQTAGLRQNFGTMTKPFHAGHAAQGAVTAALLAEKGFTADPNIIEAPLGFLNVYKGEDLQPLEAMLDRLGQHFEITWSGIAIKPYPCCGETHTGIEIATELLKEHKLSPKDIKSIECAFNETMNSVMLHHNPQTGLEGKFSSEYCVARALLDGAVKLDDFVDSRVKQPEVRELINKTKVRVDNSLPMMAAQITIELNDGRLFSKRQDTARGWADNPLKPEELAAKYRDCAGWALATKDIEKSLEMMVNLEKVDDMAKLAQVVVRREK